jgi:hypothetical protein
VLIVGGDIIDTEEGRSPHNKGNKNDKNKRAQ